MSNEAILRKAIEKSGLETDGELVEDIIDFLTDEGALNLTGRGFIFSHDFAKAFWGEEDWTQVGYTLFAHVESEQKNVMTQPKVLKAYEYHLQQMALAEEPLQYLAQFL